jgi:uncharacterized membrane protein YdjX (TVP38/TMEM64 family)
MTVVIYLCWDRIMELMEPFFFWFSFHIYSGIFYFMLIYILFVVLMVPSTFLTLGGAAIFSASLGPTKAFLIHNMVVLSCQIIGGVIAMLIARYFMQDFIKKHIITRIKMFTAIDNGLNKSGIRMVILMRMTPVIPYNIFNYAMGVTSLSVKDFVLGSVGMIPWTAAYIYVGVNLEGMQDLFAGTYDLGPYTGVYVVVGACTAIMMTMLVIMIAKSELDKMLEVEKEQSISSSRNSLFQHDMFEDRSL